MTECKNCQKEFKNYKKQNVSIVRRQNGNIVRIHNVRMEQF